MNEQIIFIIEELAALFREAELQGNDRIVLESMVGSRFHERVKEAEAHLLGMLGAGRVVESGE